MSGSGLYECQVFNHDDVEKKLKMPVRIFVLGNMREYFTHFFAYYISLGYTKVLE